VLKFLRGAEDLDDKAILRFRKGREIASMQSLNVRVNFDKPKIVVFQGRVADIFVDAITVEAVNRPIGVRNNRRKRLIN
jgi:hypothetical protein